MSPIGIAVLGAFSTLAGFAFLYLSPIVLPKLPPFFSSNKVMLSLTTGLLIVGTVWLSYIATKAVGQGRRAPVRV